MARRLGWKRPPTKVNKRLKKYQQILKREMRDALGIATLAVRDSAKRRAYPAKFVSGSDSETRKEKRFAGRTPIRKKIIRSENKGQISAIPYYVYARTKAIKALYTAFGRRSRLSRKGLVLYRPWINLSRLQYVEYNKDKNLKKWAIARRMMEKDKVLVQDPRILNALLLVPAMKRQADTIKKVYDSAFISAGAKF